MSYSPIRLNDLSVDGDSTDVVDDSPFDLSLVPIDDEPPNDDPVDQSKELTYDHLTSSHHHSQSNDDDRENNNVTSWSPNGGLSTLTSRVSGTSSKPTTPSGPIRPARRGGNQSPGTFRGTRMTYAELITEAIKSSPDLRLTLQQIYVWMVKNVPEFSPNQNGQQGGPTSSSWKNSIRHNLSLHSKFQKIQNEEPGKSSFWCLNINDNQHPRDYYVPMQKRRSSRRTSSTSSNNSVFYSNQSKEPMNSSLQVTRDGLVSPSTLRSQPQPMQKPTCPPNATVQAEFQTFNVNKLLKNSDLVSFEEELVKAKYPLLASIIIGNTTYREQPQQRTDKTQWSQEGTPHYVDVPYDEVYDETTNLVGQHEADEVNNWQHFLVNPAFDEKKIEADYHADHQSPTPHDSSHETMITLDEDDPNLNDFNDIFNMALLTSSDASSTSSYFAGTA